jgi:hypothetical protein
MREVELHGLDLGTVVKNCRGRGGVSSAKRKTMLFILYTCSRKQR